MKIGVSAQSSDPKGSVDPRFGRTAWFLVFDTETKAYTAVSNQQVLNLPQGAGIQAARQLIDQDVAVVLTGHCGPKAFETLKAAKVSVVVGATGAVSDVLERYLAGDLQPSDAPDVEGHW